MSHGDTASNLNLNSSKTGARPSGEALESQTGNAADVSATPDQRLDHAAMESAKRAQNRIHDNEENTPGNTIFSK